MPLKSHSTAFTLFNEQTVPKIYLANSGPPEEIPNNLPILRGQHEDGFL